MADNKKLNGWAQFTLMLVILIATVGMAFGTLKSGVNGNAENIQRVEGQIDDRLVRMEHKIDQLLLRICE